MKVRKSWELTALGVPCSANVLWFTKLWKNFYKSDVLISKFNYLTNCIQLTFTVIGSYLYLKKEDLGVLRTFPEHYSVLHYSTPYLSVLDEKPRKKKKRYRRKKIYEAIKYLFLHLTEKCWRKLRRKKKKRRRWKNKFPLDSKYLVIW